MIVLFFHRSDLGGGQQDTNLFPVVDSTWKVCINSPSLLKSMYFLNWCTMFFSLRPINMSCLLSMWKIALWLSRCTKHVLSSLLCSCFHHILRKVKMVAFSFFMHIIRQHAFTSKCHLKRKKYDVNQMWFWSSLSEVAVFLYFQIRSSGSACL